MEKVLKQLKCGIALSFLLVCGALPLRAAAQSDPSQGWQTRLSIYGFLPAIDGESAYPADSGGSTVNISADKLLEALQVFFMGALDVHNGTWGMFTDFIYLDFTDSKSATRDFSLGAAGLPAGASADLELGINGTAWTLAGEYRLVNHDDLVLDMLAGARYLDIEMPLQWNLSGNLGSFSGARSGSASIGDPVVDAIVGVKGRYALGSSKWTVPFYFDIGTGESESTVQVAAGLSYSFKWLDINALYRYLGYSGESGDAIESLSFSGPQIGATFRF